MLSPVCRWATVAVTSTRRWIPRVTSAVAELSTYNVPGDDDLDAFRAIVGPAAVVTDPDDLAPHNTDWTQRKSGRSRVMVKPGSTDEVSKVLSYCNERSLPVVPQGGNTGLVLGGIPLNEEVILNLSRMNKVVDFDRASGVVSVEAGAILGDVDRWLEPHGFTVPLDLGAKDSCQVGGNTSTNAGGLRLIRYGSMHGRVIGLEAVTADGTVLDFMITLRKDNVGYDLKQLFIGSEGTLGVVTKVALSCPPRPKAINVAFLAVESFEAVQNVLSKAHEHLGEVLSAIEFLDASALGIVLDNVNGARHPLSEKYPFYALIETAGSNADHDSEKLNFLLEDILASGVALDGVVAQSESQVDSLWSLRESVAMGCGARGVVLKYDISLPLHKMYEIVEETRQRVEEFDGVLVCGYGHVGDSNLHLNVSTDSSEERADVLAVIEPWVYEWVMSAGGSISAEHGLGSLKHKYLDQAKSPEVVSLMRKMKAVFDPKGILNPGKVTDS